MEVEFVNQNGEVRVCHKGLSRQGSTKLLQ